MRHLHSRHRASAWASTCLTLTPALWLAFAALLFTFFAGDLVSTGLAMRLSQGAEGNPIAAFSLQYGLLGLAAAKLVVLFIVYLLIQLVLAERTYRARFVLTLLLFAVAALYAVVTFSNLMAAYASTDLFHYFIK